jgi:RNA polymerase-binding transcription factor DksA
MLDQKVLDELKEKLVDEKAKLDGGLQRIANPTGTPGDYETRFDNLGSEADENATEVEDYVDNLAVENDLEKQLKDVNDALERMEKGAYGFCDNCQQEIDIERLRAYPAARTCIKC